MSIHVQLMGPIRIYYPSHTCVKFRSSRVAVMLAYLITQRRPVSRSTLADLFWPDKPPSTARVNVRWAISCLRDYVPGGWAVTRSSIAFCPPEHCTVDVHQLESALQGQDVCSLAKIVPRIEGEFLAGLCLDDLPELNVWLVTEQAHWATVLLQAFVYLAEDALLQGDGGAAARWLKQASERFPWEERIHQLLMLMFVSLGHPYEALVQYERCRQAMAAAFDSTPSPGTERLYERIRSMLEDTARLRGTWPLYKSQLATWSRRP